MFLAAERDSISYNTKKKNRHKSNCKQSHIKEFVSVNHSYEPRFYSKTVFSMQTTLLLK